MSEIQDPISGDPKKPVSGYEVTHMPRFKQGDPVSYPDLPTDHLLHDELYLKVHTKAAFSERTFPSENASHRLGEPAIALRNSTGLLFPRQEVKPDSLQPLRDYRRRCILNDPHGFVVEGFTLFSVGNITIATGSLASILE
jgi:hypothetical protein